MSEAEAERERAPGVVVRRVGRMEALRRYRILVDGREVGRLWRGGRVHVPHAGGLVRVEARIDWCSAKPLAFRLEPGGAAEVEVFNVSGAAGAAWGKDILDPGNWLGLRLVHPEAGAVVAGPWG